MNPYSELLVMDLLAEELELVIPLLASRDYVLAFDTSDGRRGPPSHTLIPLRWVAAYLFAAASHEPLVDLNRLDGSTEDRDRLIARLQEWCRRNAGKSR